MKNLLPEVVHKREKFAFMAPLAHTEPRKRLAVQAQVDEHLAPSRIRAANLFDEKRVQTFLNDYEHDTDQISLVRKDALLNHLLCLWRMTPENGCHPFNTKHALRKCLINANLLIP